MSDSYTKVLPNGQVLNYTRLDGNRPRFRFIRQSAQGNLLEMGEVYNHVLTPKNINAIDPQDFDKKDGRWMTFYPYQEGQNPFDFVSSQSTYRMGFEMGNYRRFYSPDEKPYAQNLSKESGQLTGLYRVYASKPFAEITYIDMMDEKHKCFWKDGKPFMGEVVYGYGKDLIWRESILTYREGKLQPNRIRSIYTRKKLGQPYFLYARQKEDETGLASYQISPIFTQQQTPQR